MHQNHHFYEIHQNQQNGQICYIHQDYQVHHISKESPCSQESPDSLESPEQARTKWQNVEQISKQSPKLILLNIQNINLGQHIHKV